MIEATPPAFSLDLSSCNRVSRVALSGQSSFRALLTYSVACRKSRIQVTFWRAKSSSHTLRIHGAPSEITTSSSASRSPVLAASRSSRAAESELRLTPPTAAALSMQPLQVSLPGPFPARRSPGASSPPNGRRKPSPRGSRHRRTRPCRERPPPPSCAPEPPCRRSTGRSSPPAVRELAARGLVAAVDHRVRDDARRPRRVALPLDPERAVQGEVAASAVGAEIVGSLDLDRADPGREPLGFPLVAPHRRAAAEQPVAERRLDDVEVGRWPEQLRRKLRKQLLEIPPPRCEQRLERARPALAAGGVRVATAHLAAFAPVPHIAAVVPPQQNNRRVRRRLLFGKVRQKLYGFGKAAARLFLFLAMLNSPARCRARRRPCSPVDSVRASAGFHSRKSRQEQFSRAAVFDNSPSPIAASNKTVYTRRLAAA